MVAGKGRRADWAELPFSLKRILPQYLLVLDDYLKLQPHRGAKIAYLAVGASTNTQVMHRLYELAIETLRNAVPCPFGQELMILEVRITSIFRLLACLNSFVFDFLLRMRLSANNLNWFILKECLVRTSPNWRRIVDTYYCGF